MGAPRLELRGIRKAYPTVVANDGIDLAVAPGEIHAVIGENGAGKSTLMKIVYGMVRPDAGDMLWEGREVLVRSPADHAGVARAGKTVEHRERARNRGVAAAAERGAEEVQDRAPGGVPDVVGHILPPRRFEEIAQRSGDGSVLHQAILDASRYHTGRPPALPRSLRAGVRWAHAGVPGD